MKNIKYLIALTKNKRIMLDMMRIWQALLLQLFQNLLKLIKYLTKSMRNMMIFNRKKSQSNFQEKLPEKYCWKKDWWTIKETEKLLRKRWRINLRMQKIKFKMMSKIQKNIYIFQMFKINKFYFQSLIFSKIKWWCIWEHHNFGSFSGIFKDSN